MKKIIFILILITSLQSKSQVGTDYRTIESMENSMLGLWTKADNTERGIQYLIEKTDKEFYLSTGIVQKGGLEFRVKDKIRLEIIWKRKKVLIKNFPLKHKKKSKLIYLDSNRLTIRNGKNTTNYNKVE